MDHYKLPYRWGILVIAVLAYTIVLFHRMSMAVMSEGIKADFGVDGATIGLLAAAYFYPYAILQMPSGILSDKTSPRKLMSIALALTCAGTLLFALAQTATLAFIGRLGVGIGCALILMPAYKTLSNWFSPAAYVVIASTVLAGAVGISSALAGTPLAFFVEHFGWRVSTQGIFAITLVVTVLSWFFFKDSPTKVVGENIHTEELPPISIPNSIKLILSKRNFWLLSLAYAVNASVFFSFTGLWAGTYYTHVAGLSRAEMSSLLSIAASITIITPIIFASIAAKVSSRKIVLIVANGMFLALALTLFVKNGTFTKDEIFIWGILFSVVVTAPAGLYMVVARELFPKNIASTSNGLAYLFSMLGVAIFQPLIGAILDSQGYTDTLTAQMFTPICWLYLISCSIAFVGMFFMQEKDGKLI